MTCREAEPLLHARLDNELDAAGSITIDRHLEECRACSAQYAALGDLRNQIAAADLAYQLPSRLDQKLLDRFQPGSQRRFGGYLFAAAAAFAVLLVVAIPTLRAPHERSSIPSEILDAHLRALQPGHLVDVPSSDQHTVKPWFQGRTSFSPPTPDLSNDGFTLAGGRLDVIGRQPTAVIVYRRRQHVIDLYVTPSGDGDSAPHMEDLDGYHLLHWTRSNLSYWAVSDVATADLQDFGGLIRQR